MIECVPNVSEGQHLHIVERMAGAIAATPGVRLLNHSSDAAHNRSVFTFVGDAGSVERSNLYRKMKAFGIAPSSRAGSSEPEST